MPAGKKAAPPFLSISEAAQRKGLSRVTLHKYVRRGAFTMATIVGRRVIVNDARFAAWEPDRGRRRGARKR